jgi:hypothetical protein
MWISSQKVGERIKDIRGTIKEAQKETCYIILLHTVGSMLCVVIPINMCCVSINMCCILIYFIYHILNFYAIVF